MLAVANERAPAVSWRQGMAESIPFPDRSFDAVLCQFGLMFFSDRHKALREMFRVLKPEGRLVVAVWDALANIPAYAAVVALLERLAGRQAADALGAPFVLGDSGKLSKMLGDAGAVSIAITTDVGTARFPSIRVMIEADLRGWLPLVGVLLTEEQIGRILQEAQHALAQYVGSDGAVSFRISAHLATATKS